MTTLIFLFGLVACYIALNIIVREIYRASWVKELKLLAITERNRNRFGILRTELVSLARKEKLNIRSPLLKELYSCYTILMRKPDLYKDVVNSVLYLPDKMPSNKNWHLSQEEYNLIIRFAENFDELCKDYSFVYRWLARYYERHGSENISLWLKLRHIAENNEIQEAQTIKKAKEKLISFAEDKFHGQLQTA